VDAKLSERTELLSRVSFLSHLESKAVGALAVRSLIDRWPEGAKIVTQGERGDRFYVMLDGRATVSVDAKAVAELRAGDQFGEIAVLHDVPRRADVVTSTPAVTLSLHRDDFLPAVRSRLLLG
jgi:CRP-like cAMP-binding protein